MKTTAGVIQAACKAGLLLRGANEYGEPEWIGTREQFTRFDRILSPLLASPIYLYKK